MAKNGNKRRIEWFFETLLWNSRFGAMLAVIFAAMGSISLFIVGSAEIFQTILKIFFSANVTAGYENILISFVGAIDLYLVAIILLLFSFGVYELFISKIDPARLNQDINILEIQSLDELKNKVLKVIVMVLVVSFFKGVLSMDFETPLEITYFAFSILAVSIGVYLIRKKDAEA